MKYSSSLLLAFALVVVLGFCASQVLSQNADGWIPPYNKGFRWGINYGYTSGWSDADKIKLGVKIGLNSRRIKLPEPHLETWGYNIEVGDAQTADSYGQSWATAFLVGASNAHTTNPSPDGSNEAYPPAGLYEPIWTDKATKTPNPNNYWAAYLVKMYAYYKPYVAVWEIWNEPDFTNTWDVTYGRSDKNDWWNRAPLSSELTNWKGTNFFSYVRLLRVTYEVLHTLDSSARVATGGLGYYSFVDALCRYTDNPVDGSKNANYPLTGCSYFDINSIHFYPHNAVHDVTTLVWNKNKDSDNWAGSFITHKNNFDTVLKKYGYGVTKPGKLTVCTETGVSSETAYAGGNLMRRNFLMKLAILSKVNAVAQIHTYDCNDDGSTGTYQTMGAYGVLTTSNKNPDPKSSSIPAAMMKQIGFYEAYYDPVRTAALQAETTGFKAYAFGSKTGKSIYAIWKTVTVNGSEAGESVSAGSVSFTSPGSTITQVSWDYSVTNSAVTLTKNGNTGKFTASVTGTPVFFYDTSASAGLGANGAPKAVSSLTATPTTTTALVKWGVPLVSTLPYGYYTRFHKTGTEWPTAWVYRQYTQWTYTGLSAGTSYEVQVQPWSADFGYGPITTKQFNTVSATKSKTPTRTKTASRTKSRSLSRTRTPSRSKQ